jgi:hypothetical protein
MNDIARIVTEWMASGKQGWESAVQSIKAMDISGEGCWQDYLKALRQQALYGWEFDQLLRSDPLLTSISLQELQAMYHLYYQDIMPGADAYEVCFANPDYAVQRFGAPLGQLMAAIYLSIRPFRAYVRDGNYSRLQANAKFLLKLVNCTARTRRTMIPCSRSTKLTQWPIRKRASWQVITPKTTPASHCIGISSPPATSTTPATSIASGSMWMPMP